MTSPDRPYLRPVPNASEAPPRILAMEAEIARLTANNRRLTSIVCAQQRTIDADRRQAKILNWLTLAGLIFAIVAFVAAIAAGRFA